MKSIYNIRSIVSALMLLVALGANAQSTQSSYFMESVGARSFLNPALRPSQGYVGFPLLGNVYLDVKTNTFNLDHFTFHKGDAFLNFMDKEVTFDEFMKNIAEDNYASINFDYTLFSAGWYAGKGFYSFNVGIKSFTDVNVPKDFFGLMKGGFDAYNTKTYNLGDLNATGSTFLELGLGYSRTFLDDRLSVGIRGKFLTGVANFDTNIQHFAIEAGEDRWKTQAEIYMHASAPGISAKYDEKGIFDEFDYDAKFNPAGYGGAVDLGVEYGLFFNRLKISAAVTDLGAVKWDKSNTVALRAKGEGEYDPSEIITSFDSNNNGTPKLEDQLEDQFNKLKEVADLKEDPSVIESRTTRLRTNVLLGLEYEIISRKLSVGFLHTTRFATYQNVSENTLSLNLQPMRWLGLTGSYSFNHSAYDAFGAAIHIAPPFGLNLFIAADYVTPHINSDFIPTTAKGTNIQVGLTIPIGKRR